MLFQSLCQFYNSTEWRRFRDLLILERTNPIDGILYDEYSGKPLLKKPEIILHHKIPLTMQNVNDRSISLNPENIMIVSIASHNKIHKRFGGQLKQEDRKVYYVWGSPLSGKSTFVKNNAEAGDLICDVDILWQAISGQPFYIKPNELKTNIFQLRDCLLEQIKMRSGKWNTAWVIEGGALQAERKRRIEALGAESIYIECTKEEALRRLANDETRIQVQAQWEIYINDWFEKFQPDFIQEF